MSGPVRARATGQALVEFAFVLPLILLLIFGVVDFGRAIFAFNTVSESARQANRLAIVDQDPVAIRTQARASAPALSLADTDIDVCFKTAGTLQRDCSAPATDDCTPVQIGCLAIVTSRTTFTPITPIIGQIVGALPIDSTSIGPIEHVP